MPPRTVVVNPKTPGPSLTFELPTTFGFDVQSVLANIDASGAGDTIAEIVVADVSGAVIATKRQGEPIPAGDTGSATWALRLTDDDGAAVERTVQWFFGFGGPVAGNQATAGNTELLAASTVGPATQYAAASAARTVTAGASLGMAAINRSGVDLIFNCSELNLQRIGVAGDSKYRGNSTVIADGVTAQIPVNTLVFGPGQLNLANPNIPTVVNAGTYVANVTIIIRRVP